jgi:ribonuclease Z
MAARELTVLGTASMAPTRYRAHGSYALRWDDQLVLFDPGEGTQRGCVQSGIAVAKATAVCITHFHGDHCLGLPGIVQRRSHDASTAEQPLPKLPVFYPADGQVFFDRLRTASIYHDVDAIEARPVDAAGIIGNIGSASLRAAPLQHRATTFGYRIDEPDGHSIDADRLAALGIEGPDVGLLIEQGWLDTARGRVSAEEVSVPKPGQSMAFVMDTMPCESALELARGVDLLVCESTYLHSEADLAHEYMHMTARQAGQLATEAGARRLVLSHFSARYESNAVFEQEAAEYHHDVVAASDLMVIDVPPRIR